jgi:hypothetical protein
MTPNASLEVQCAVISTFLGDIQPRDGSLSGVSQLLRIEGCRRGGMQSAYVISIKVSHRTHAGECHGATTAMSQIVYGE